MSVSAGSLVLGAVLTFASTDGAELALTVSTAATATASLEWGGVVHTSTTPARRHRFGPLPTPREASVEYVLRVAGGAPFVKRVRAIPEDGLRIALYGDSRDGHGPHRTLLEAIRAAEPHVVVHTGDVVHRAGVDAQWTAYLGTSLPLSSEVPVVLALGNHELWQPSDVPEAERVDALAEAMAEMPPPPDPAARAAKADIATFHVRLGPVLLLALNSNTTMDVGSAQLDFLARVVRANEDATFRLAAMHHGPASSGKHGPHRHAEAVQAAFERHRITASLGGHDHTYERIERGPVTYLVSGGGGAPLYQRRHLELGSVAFASTYNWSMLTFEGDRMTIESYSLEGALLDRAERPARREGPRPTMPWTRLLGGAGVLLLALLGVIWGLVRGRPLAPSARRG